MRRRSTHDLPKSLLGDTVMTLLEHEHGTLERDKFACLAAEVVDLFLHGIADEDHRAHSPKRRPPAALPTTPCRSVMPRPAIDPGHQLPLRRVGDPPAGTALVEATIIVQADIETAKRRRFTEHVGL